MDPETLGTKNPVALRGYLRGRDAFRSYWKSHKSDDLKAAETYFGQASAADTDFSLVAFYLAIVESELRKHDAAISRLTGLVAKGVDFLTEALIHLAYAHTKKYKDDDYRAADRYLTDAEGEATKRGRTDLIPAIRAYRVFLYAVIGGRSKTLDRSDYLRKAIRLGEELLPEVASDEVPGAVMVRFEVLNALGIALMRRGQRDNDLEAARKDWGTAEESYNRALGLSPNSPRVLQNLGTLRVIEGDRLRELGDQARAIERYREARRFYQRSVDINPLDQFPHYSMSKVCARLGEWKDADTWYQSGRPQPGSVPEDLWANLRDAIDKRDASGLMGERN